MDEDAAEYVPAAHAPVTAERPVVAQYDPAGQAEQAIAPVEAKKAPVEQLVQAADEEVDAYVPTRQEEQVDAEAAA